MLLRCSFGHDMTSGARQSARAEGIGMTPACSGCTSHEYFFFAQHFVVKAALRFAFAMSSYKQSE